MAASAASKRLLAWRRKITPSTGMQYSLLVSLELARNWSAASHRLASILVRWVSAVLVMSGRGSAFILVHGKSLVRTHAWPDW